jgi:haloacetate dehalogenase
MVSEKPRLRRQASQGRVRRLHPLLHEKTILGACRHYRANATIDFEADIAAKGRLIATPLLVLWGTRGAPPTQEYPTVWRRFASNLVDAQPLPTGHALQVEAPDRVYDQFVKFFTA